MRVGIAAATMAAFVVSACIGGGKPDPRRDALRQPTGLALDPLARWLFVSGGNWDQGEAGGTVMAIDLSAVHESLAGSVGSPDAALSGRRPCRRVAPGDATIECDPRHFIEADQTVVLGSAVGNIVIDQPSGEAGRLRLLVSQRIAPAVAWVDVVPQARGVDLDCGQDASGECDQSHLLTAATGGSTLRLPADPSRVFVDQGGFRFAYVPHLIDGSLSLIDLDGEFGPELSAVEREFYRTATFEDLDVAGGFAVAQRGCDPADPPRASRDCSRPLLYSTHRFFPGMRSFTAAPGLEVVVPGGNIDLAALGSEVVESRPFMGDLEFESDASLLVVQTTPGGLARVDTSLDEDGNPRNTLLETVALCDNPNILELFAPENGEPLALVTCFGDGLLAVIGLGSFSVLQTIQLGAGANEIAVDSARAQAYVANTREDTISIVSLDPGDPAYLTEWARLGVGVGAR